MRRGAWLAATAPGALGLLAGLAMEGGLFANPIFVGRVQATAGVLAGLLGLVASGVALAAVGLAARWRGVVERAAAREREAQAEAHRRFVHRLDHELKNPLTAIRAGLANLDSSLGRSGAEGPGSEGEGPAAASLANVQRQAERLAGLVHDLRKLADLETREVERAPVDLAEVIAEAVELARSLPGREGQAVAVRLQSVPWPLSPVEGDRDLLLLAAYNLVDNACKFAGPAAAVEVRASEDGAWATLEVADTGPGIDSDDLPHLGEELYRGRSAQGTEGSGLGLALVRRIAARHGGTLTVRSRLGQGTVVTLRLPLGRR